MIGAGAAVGAGAALYAWRESKWVELSERVVVEVADLPAGLDGLRILHISDTHFPQNGESLPRFLAAVRAQRYDIVFATGDYGDSDRGWPAALEAFRQIDPKLGIYAVLGGHERYRGGGRLEGARQLLRELAGERRQAVGDPAPFVEQMRQAGVHVLENESIAVEVEGDVVRLIGVDDAWTGVDDLPAAMNGHPGGEPPGFKILLSHSPDAVLQPLARRIPLAFCGHTHGGQIRIPFYGAPVRHARAVDRAHAAGVVRIGATQVCISRGFGTTSVPLRLFCRPEVGVVELRRAAGSSGG